MAENIKPIGSKQLLTNYHEERTRRKDKSKKKQVWQII